MSLQSLALNARKGKPSKGITPFELSKGLIVGREDIEVAPKSKIESVPVPAEWALAIKDAYTRYPNLPKGSIETTLMMESSMGRDKSNEKYDYGPYGWVAGHTKNGGFTQTLKNAKANAALAAKYKVLERDEKGAYKVPGIEDLSTPYAAIQATASELAKGHVNNPHLTDPADVYFKYYNANPKSNTPQRRETFNAHFNFYGSTGDSLTTPEKENGVKSKATGDLSLI